MSCIYPALGLKTTKIDFDIHLIMDLPFFASSWVQKTPKSSSGGNQMAVLGGSSTAISFQFMSVSFNAKETSLCSQNQRALSPFKGLILCKQVCGAEADTVETISKQSHAKNKSFTFIASQTHLVALLPSALIC